MMFGAKKHKTSLRLVVAVNQVDKMIPNGWDERLNMPNEQAAREISIKCNDIAKNLASYGVITIDQIEYYSALKRYRLLPLLAKIIGNAYAGFKLDNVEPADPFDLADPEVKAFVDEQRRERDQINPKTNEDVKKQLFQQMRKFLSKDDLNLVLSKLRNESSRPPKIAIFGKSGVGKTTTINSLFNAKWKTSHTIEGTTSAQMRSFSLSTGGTLDVVDLPGYGRSTTQDEEYDKIYQEFIPTCDLVLLIVQANSRDLADDQEMILKVFEWLKNSPIPSR
jgi:predicted GTPase